MTQHNAVPGVVAGFTVWVPVAWALAISIPGIASPVSAQTDAEVNAGIQFDFSTPGARSLGMGGAFVGLADDATAAFTNPAGLLQLEQSDLSMETRHFDFTHTFTDGGHAFGFATGIGVDTIEGLRPGQTVSDTSGLSFVSYVYPRKKASGSTEWALAVYRHELVNFEAAFETRGAFFDFFENGTRLTSRLQPIRAALDLEIVNFGLSTALRLSDSFHVGFGVSFYELEIDALQQRFSAAGIDPDTGFLPRDAPGAPFGPPDFSPRNESDFQEQVGTDEKTGFNAGFLWHVHPKWSLGGVYRQGPEFVLDAVSRIGFFLERLSGDPRGTVIEEQTAPFNVPDIVALGLAFKPSAKVRVTVDYNRIEYSALTKGTISIFESESFLDPTERAALEALTVDDGNIVRAGFEFLPRIGCPGSKVRDCSVGVRFGAWRDPDHKVRFSDEPGFDDETRAQAIQFTGGEDETHLSAGVGFVFKRRFQIDAAADFSDTVDTVSLSAIVRLGS